jgi:hypothetical protein
LKPLGCLAPNHARVTALSIETSPETGAHDTALALTPAGRSDRLVQVVVVAVGGFLRLHGVVHDRRRPARSRRTRPAAPARRDAGEVGLEVRARVLGVHGDRDALFTADPLDLGEHLGLALVDPDPQHRAEMRGLGAADSPQRQPHTVEIHRQTQHAGSERVKWWRTAAKTA